MTLTIIRGLPGSGKSMYAYYGYKGSFIVDMNALATVDGVCDPLKALTSACWATMLAITSLALMNGTDVVVVAPFVTIMDMRRYLDIGGRQGATIKVIKIINKNIKTWETETEAEWEDFDGETAIVL